jgi:purine-binding chemotaxis protein CheW
MSIDWQRMHRAVEAAAEAVAARRAPSAEAARRILQERAEALATPPRAESEEETLSVLEFRLAYERYGIESGYVAEVCPIRAYTQLPCTPPLVFGVVNVRGRIATVLDLRRLFELPEGGISDLNKVILLRGEGGGFGILADAVTGIRSVPVSALQAELSTFTGVRRDWLRGVTPDQVAVLDAEKLLKDPKLVINEQPGG